MRRYKIFISTLLILLFSSVAIAQKGPKDVFHFPKLGEIKMPKVETRVLKNGMKLFLVEDHQYPTIDLRAMIRVGSIYEPPDKIGLASITGTVMRTGGTKTRPGDQLDEELEALAARVETGIGLNSGYAYMSVLKEDIDKGLEILADVLMNPAFPEDKIELAKVQERTWIARRNDEPIAINYREFAKLIYGAESPYARHPEYETIDNITREDLIAFHKKYFHPNNVLLAAWGDFETEDMIKKIERAFRDWKPAEIDFPPKPEVKYEYKYTVNFIRKEDVNQSNISIGHIGGLMNNPDYPALAIMNRILSFDRLFKRVRTTEGLAYHVSGYYGANYDYPGIFRVVCETKSESTVKAIKIILEEIKRITQEEVTDEELEKAKDSFLNSWVFNFDSKAKIVRRLMTYEYFGYPPDFLQRIREGVEKVTKADILRVAQKYLRPDELQILVVGNDRDFDEPLSVLGPVNEIDITIPEPKAEAVPEATPESLMKGRELLGRAVQACGGLEAFKAIKNVLIKSEISMTIPAGGEMGITSTVTFLPPDKIHQVMSLPFGEISQVMVKDSAWVVSPQGVQDMPESQKKEMKANLFRDLINLFRASDSEAITAQWLGEEEVEGKRAEVILISDTEGNSVKLFLDAETHLPLKQSYQGTTMTGPATIEEIYSQYRQVSEVKIPFHTLINAAGKKYAEVKVMELKINTEVNPKLFQR